MSTSRAYANPNVEIVTTLLIYVISNVNIINIIQYLNMQYALHFKEHFNFQCTNLMNNNDIYSNGWPKITI
jgi:hypothetical protein